jgi:hypothetical protein
MGWFTLLLQGVLPVGLLLWLYLASERGMVAWGVQYLAVALTLLGLALASLWNMPPFWTPWLYGLVFAVLLVRHLVKRRVTASQLWSAGPLNTVLIILATGLGVAGVQLSTGALQGRLPPDGETVDIAPPLGPGHYLVAHGGSTKLVNAHLATLDPSKEQFRRWRGQSRALDIFAITPAGFHMDGWWPADPARYETFGRPVVAPCSGTVARAVDRFPDMRVPEMDKTHKAGNYVAVNCGDFFVVLAHLRADSVRVEKSDRVDTGEVLGEAGNSGNTSEPHLHVHAQRGLDEEAPLSGEPLALTIKGRFLVRNDRFRVKSGQSY